MIINNIKNEDNFGADEMKTNLESFIKENKSVNKTMIGGGAFGQVFLLEGKEKEQLALKVISKENLIESLSSSFKRELSVLTKITKHPNLIKLFSSGKYYENLLSKTSSQSTKENSSSDYLLMEYAENGCLFDLIICERKGLKSSIARNIFLQILNGVEALHNEGFAHGDLKTENILVQGDWSIKLCDFGNSYLFNESSDFKASDGATKGYTAPEILNGYWAAQNGDKCDVFSLGVILFILLTANIPFQNTSNTDGIYRKIKYNMDSALWNVYYKLLNINFEGSFKTLFISMMQCEPKKRATLKEVRNSEWLKGEVASNEEVKEELLRRKCILKKNV